MATTPYPVAARDLLRTTLLDAAHGLLETRPWSAVSMAEVARAAGVSRQTLYKQFNSREEFAQAYVLRESERFLVRVREAVLAHRADPVRALRAAFDAFLEAADDEPLVRALVSGGAGSEELLALVTTQGRPLVDQTTRALADVIDGQWPQVGRRDAVLLAECLVRLAISRAALPEGPAQMDGAAVMRLLGPHVRHVTSRGA